MADQTNPAAGAMTTSDLNGRGVANTGSEVKDTDVDALEGHVNTPERLKEHLPAAVANENRKEERAAVLNGQDHENVENKNVVS